MIFCRMHIVTARDMIILFGKAKVSASVLSALDEGSPDKLFEVMQYIRHINNNTHEEVKEEVYESVFKERDEPEGSFLSKNRHGPGAYIAALFTTDE